MDKNIAYNCYLLSLPLGRRTVSGDLPESNDCYRGPTQLHVVQHFAYRGSSHRRKSAARHRLGSRVVAVNLLQLPGRMLKTALGYADLPLVIGNHISLLIKSFHR